MIILVGSQKGGCGKSTLAVNICVSLSNNGGDVVLVDTDKQGTSSNWCSDRGEKEGVSTVHCIQKYGNISDALMDLNSQYEYIVVDSAARDSQELRTGMAISDKLIVPFRPSQPDLDTLPQLHAIITRAKNLNPKLGVFALLTMVSTNPWVKEVNEALEYIKGYPSIKPLSSYLKERKIYRDAISEGLGVVEMNNLKAKTEINHVIKEVFNDQT